MSSGGGIDGVTLVPTLVARLVVLALDDRVAALDCSERILLDLRDLAVRAEFCLCSRPFG